MKINPFKNPVFGFAYFLGISIISLFLFNILPFSEKGKIIAIAVFCVIGMSILTICLVISTGNSKFAKNLKKIFEIKE